MKNSNSDFARIALNKFHFLLLNFSVGLAFVTPGSTYASANIKFSPGIYQKTDTTKKAND